MNERHFTLTSAVGKFIFKRSTQMSHAKLVRDTIMGELRLNGTRIPNSEAATLWIHDHVMGPARFTEFEWVR